MSPLSMILAITGLVVAIAIAGMAGWRFADARLDAATRDALAATAEVTPAAFDPAMVAGLPEPARRYFSYTIAPGTPLSTVVEIEMTGELGLGDKETPRYAAMRARQIIAPPHGFVWQPRTDNLSGSDGLTAETSWTRFWLFGLVPVVRAGGDDDHRRSAFGRLIAEAAFWVPASLLPGPHVVWEPVDDDTARAIVQFHGMRQNVDITVDAQGRPVAFEIARWSDVNADKRYRLQPFGGRVSEFADFAGYQLPTRVEAGNHFGTDDYFPFFKSQVTDLRVVGSGAE